MITIRLNTKTIADEIMSLTALRATVAGERPAALLTRDNLPGLRIIIRMVFAETVLELSNFITDCNIDENDPDVPQPYDEDGDSLTLELTLRKPANSHSADNNRTLAIKRKLEHIVAMGTLAWVATKSDTDFAGQLQVEREAALAALKDSLAADMEPCSLFSRLMWP